MADDSTIDRMQSMIDSLNSPSAASQAAEEAKKTSSDSAEGIGQTEFLNMLVAQLKNQDPLNPMDNQNFATQLAQFSQLEQLMSINETLSGGSATSVSSMASFLGQEVVLSDTTATISDGKGPNLCVEVPTGLQSARLDIIGSSGGVAKSMSLDVDSLGTGKQFFSLDSLDIDDGDYTFRFVGVNESGAFEDMDYKVTGTVDGFVMEPEPKLLVNGKEVSVDDISEVLKGQS